MIHNQTKSYVSPIQSLIEQERDPLKSAVLEHLIKTQNLDELDDVAIEKLKAEIKTYKQCRSPPVIVSKYGVSTPPKDVNHHELAQSHINHTRLVSDKRANVLDEQRLVFHDALTELKKDADAIDVR